MARKDTYLNNTMAGKSRREKVFGSPVRNLLICAVVCILLGVAFIVQPSLVYSYCGYAIGGLVALVGLVFIIIYFARKPASGEYRSEFAIGIVALCAGGYLALGAYFGGKGIVDLGFEVLVRIIGALIALDGILKLQYSLDIARMRFRGWWVLLILSLLGIPLGVLTFLGYTYDLGSVLSLKYNPALNEAQNAFINGMTTLGMAFCLNGLLDILGMIVILVRNYKASRAAAVSEGSAMMAYAQQQELRDTVSAAAPAGQPVTVPAGAVVVPAPGGAAESAAAEPVLARPPAPTDQ